MLESSHIQHKQTLFAQLCQSKPRIGSKGLSKSTNTNNCKVTHKPATVKHSKTKYNNSMQIFNLLPMQNYFSDVGLMRFSHFYPAPQDYNEQHFATISATLRIKSEYDMQNFNANSIQ